MRLKSVFLLGLPLLIQIGSAHALDYKIDSAHSQILFKVKHLGISSVTGRFDKFEGAFSYDPAKLTDAKTEAKIDVTSINTNQTKRDNHLKSPDFFAAEQFPQLTFKSKQVKAAGEGKLQIVGDLTIRGNTHEITLDTEFAGTAKDPAGKQRAAFTATGTLNRKEYGLKWNDLTEAGGVLVGDEVKITLEVEGVEDAPVAKG